MGFDPKKYLAEAEQVPAPQAAPGFNPQAYLQAADDAPVPQGQQVYASPIGPNPTLAQAPMAWAKEIGYSGSEGQITSHGAPKPVTGAPPLATPMAAAPKALQGLAGFFGGSAKGRASAGAIQGAAGDSEDRVRGAVVGAGMSLGLDGLSKMLTKPGDAAMQIAVGRKKYTPGVGTTLADEGIVGTERMMERQVGRKLQERGSELGELASEIPGTPFNSQEIARSVAKDAARPMIVPGGQPSAADMTKLSTIREFAEDVASRGAESGPQALSRRVAAGGRSYRGKEDPLQSLVGQLSKLEQQKYSQALKDAHAATSGGSQFADTDKAYAALKRAQAGLSEETSLPKSLGQIIFSGVHKLPGGSAVMSTAGQGLTKSGQLASGANNPLLRGIALDRKKDRK